LIWPLCTNRDEEHWHKSLGTFLLRFRTLPLFKAKVGQPKLRSANAVIRWLWSPPELIRLAQDGAAHLSVHT